MSVQYTIRLPHMDKLVFYCLQAHVRTQATISHITKEVDYAISLAEIVIVTLLQSIIVKIKHQPSINNRIDMGNFSVLLYLLCTKESIKITTSKDTLPINTAEEMFFQQKEKPINASLPLHY